jgi:hypothetical protein
MSIILLSIEAGFWMEGLIWGITRILFQRWKARFMALCEGKDGYIDKKRSFESRGKGE